MPFRNKTLKSNKFKALFWIFAQMKNLWENVSCSLFQVNYIQASILNK